MIGLLLGLLWQLSVATVSMWDPESGGIWLFPPLKLSSRGGTKDGRWLTDGANSCGDLGCAQHLPEHFSSLSRLVFWAEALLCTF